MSSVRGFISGFVVGLVGSAVAAAVLALVFPLNSAPVAEAESVAEQQTDAAELPAVAVPEALPEAPAEETVTTPAADTEIAATARQTPLNSGPGLTPTPETAAAPKVEASVKPAPTAMTAIGQDTTPQAEPSSDPAPVAMTEPATPGLVVEDAPALPQTAMSDTPDASSEPASKEVAMAPAPAQDATPSVPEDRPATATEAAPETETTTPRQPVTNRVVEKEPEAPAQVDPAQPAADAPAASSPDAGDAEAIAEERSAPPAQPILEGPAFEAFAAEYVDATNKPLLSIVLLDIGADGIERKNLTSFGTAITFAIRADDPDARWADDAYREAGFEVLAMVPENGAMKIGQRTPTVDISPFLKAYFDAVPGAIGLIDRPLGDLYRNIRVVDEVTDSLKSSGRALVVHERFGVNATLQVARSKDIPAGSILRVIDTERDESAIRSALERAALEASKTGAAVVFGRTYPETVTTLITWLLSNSARSISVAPLSAVIKKAEQ